MPGLAHFCEHLVFLGTKKYPDEAEYNAYLARHAGYSNAYTGLENTNFFFELSSAGLKEGLDRFAQFFISPLFNQDCVERELLAVDSEHSKNVQNDAWRIYQLEKSIASPKHNFSKFGTGNRSTLRNGDEEVVKALKEFHAKYYSSNLMRLAVVGKEPLEVLTDWVQESFQAIPYNQAIEPISEGTPFGAEQLNRRIYANTIKEMRQMSISWPFPDYRNAYNTHPERYIGHILGHEGKGSLLSLLKNKGFPIPLISH